MKENGIVLNYFYLGLKWACVMMLFIKDYLVQFNKCNAFYMQNIMPSADGAGEIHVNKLDTVLPLRDLKSGDGQRHNFR